jgi:hypothetical protein
MAGNRTLKLSILADVDDLKKKLDTGSKEVEGFGGKLEKFGKVAAAAFAAAAAAAAAYAAKLAIDGVKAAIEDEAAQNRLANALKNVTGATEDQIASVEKQISKLSLANGVADDKLRPAYQRLATATGDLSKASGALTLALDISAATGKDVEAVSNALGKAYEGNTTALARLGIGMSTAEIKTLGLDGTMQQLAKTFGGAATVQANTLEGQIARLKVGFDEAKESVGAALLPIIQKFMDYIMNNFIPMLKRAKEQAVDPIIEAFNNNRESLEQLWSFIKTYLVPILEQTLVASIVRVGKGIAVLLEIVGSVMDGIKAIVRTAIESINTFINLVNKLPGVNIQTLGVPSFAQNKQTGGTISSSTGSINIPTPYGSSTSTGSTSSLLGGATTRSTSTNVPVTAATTAAKESAKVVADAIAESVIDWMPSRTGTAAGFRAFESGDVINMPGIPSNFDVARVRAAESGVTIVVQAPSAIDEEGFTRAVVNAMNQTQARTGGGGSQLVL